jgi:hypothetical protein
MLSPAHVMLAKAGIQQPPASHSIRDGGYWIVRFPAFAEAKPKNGLTYFSPAALRLRAGRRGR